MMELIPLPNAAQERNSQLRLSLETPSVVHDRLIMGPWTLNCPRCDSKLEFKCDGLVFRKLEFYCSSCSSFHVVTNPAFVPDGKNRK